jgi:hypothetical protein
MPYGQRLIANVSYPFVLVISPTCGYTMFVNAVIAGVVLNPIAEGFKRAGASTDG